MLDHDVAHWGLVEERWQKYLGAMAPSERRDFQQREEGKTKLNQAEYASRRGKRPLFKDGGAQPVCPKCASTLSRDYTEFLGPSRINFFTPDGDNWHDACSCFVTYDCLCGYKYAIGGSDKEGVCGKERRLVQRQRENLLLGYLLLPYRLVRCLVVTFIRF